MKTLFCLGGRRMKNVLSPKEAWRERSEERCTKEIKQVLTPMIHGGFPKFRPIQAWSFSAFFILPCLCRSPLGNSTCSTNTWMCHVMKRCCLKCKSSWLHLASVMKWQYVAPITIVIFNRSQWNIAVISGWWRSEWPHTGGFDRPFNLRRLEWRKDNAEARSLTFSVYSW